MTHRLYQYASSRKLDIVECKLPSDKLKGLYADDIIFLSENIETEVEKKCILAEEIGHYETSHGHILNNSTNSNKQEKKARTWAYHELIKIESFIEASNKGIRSRYELAEYLDVTEEFLADAITRFIEIYGPYRIIGNYTVYFEPLGVFEFGNFE